MSRNGLSLLRDCPACNFGWLRLRLKPVLSAIVWLLVWLFWVGVIFTVLAISQ